MDTRALVALGKEGEGIVYPLVHPYTYVTTHTPQHTQVSAQWFVKMDGMASQALGAVRTGELKILPEQFEKTWYVCVSREGGREGG